MHLHFVQSLEPLQGAGLGQAALSLHLAMRKESVAYGPFALGPSSASPSVPQASAQCSVFSVQRNVSEPIAPSSSLHAPCSTLLATRGEEFTREWPDVIQGIRRGPGKAFYAPELKQLAAEAVEQAEWFHGHGLYVWTNMWLGGLTKT